MPTVLVTGGAGFIGSHLCEELLRRRDRVAIVDLFDDFYDPRLKLANLEQLKSFGKYEFFQTDIRDCDNLSRVFEQVRPDQIVHLAARAGVRPSLLEPARYVSTNVSGTLNLLELSRKHRVQRFVFASSSSVYGEANRVPFSEDDPVTKPLSVYAATKVAGEALAFTYAHLYQLSVICLRIFTVYGPRQRPDLAIRKFATLIDRGDEVPVFGDGSAERDYTYVSDIVSGIVKALECKQSFEIFNLGNSHPVRLDYVIDVLENALGKKAMRKYLPPQPGDMPVTYANLGKSRRLLGYEPQVSFKKGVLLFVQWFNANK